MAHDKCCPQDHKLKLAWEEDLEEQSIRLPLLEDLLGKCEVLGTLSHPIRLQMAYHLQEKESCVCELVKITGMEPNLVSYHLSKMNKSGVVSSYNKSRWKYYSLNDKARPLLDALSK